jgi:precorrin-4/cobalt-precorrin-4 C11-methyltransferase
MIPAITGTVWFVGAGPGDPELITVKGRRLLEQAGAVLFAGSLVDQAATQYAPAACLIRDSKDMTLDEMTQWLEQQARQHSTVVRLQTGDPALYGALIEMTRPLTAAGITWAVVPGVSSAMASMAAAGESMTLPEVTLVVHKASWPGEERIVRGTLADIKQRCRDAGIVSQAMVIASPTLGAAGWDQLVRSKLYDPAFTHRFRKAIA